MATHSNQKVIKGFIAHTQVFVKAHECEIATYAPNSYDPFHCSKSNVPQKEKIIDIYEPYVWAAHSIHKKNRKNYVFRCKSTLPFHFQSQKSFLSKLVLDQSGITKKFQKIK